jgi:hypothetical protein
VESLALTASVAFLVAAVLGPAAAGFSFFGYVYVGGTIGVLAVGFGVWWTLVAGWPAGVVGAISVCLGLCAALQACRADRPE